MQLLQAEPLALVRGWPFSPRGSGAKGAFEFPTKPLTSWLFNASRPTHMARADLPVSEDKV